MPLIVDKIQLLTGGYSVDDSLNLCSLEEAQVTSVVNELQKIETKQDQLRFVLEHRYLFSGIFVTTVINIDTYHISVKILTGEKLCAGFYSDMGNGRAALAEYTE